MPASIEIRRQREARHNTVAELWLRCVSLDEIARRCGVHRSQISRDLQSIRAEWARSRPDKYDERLTDELARLDRLESVAWDAWDRSCHDQEVRNVKTVRHGDSERTEASKRQEGQAGDPRFLDRVGWCINRRIELLGLDAPKKLDLGGKIIVNHDSKFAQSLLDNPQAADLACQFLESLGTGLRDAGRIGVSGQQPHMAAGGTPAPPQP